MVGVEVAVHTDQVFIDGRTAAGPQVTDIEKIARDVYRTAGYCDSWTHDPRDIRVITDFCRETLPADESDIRPLVYWTSRERLSAWLRRDAHPCAIFGRIFKSWHSQT